jgi:hypothetical protein
MIDIAKLVKRLRVLAEWEMAMGTSEPSDHIAWEAADALEAQAKEIAELKEIMRQLTIAVEFSNFADSTRDLTLAARAALNGEK